MHYPKLLQILLRLLALNLSFYFFPVFWAFSQSCQVKGRVTSYQTKQAIEARLVFEKQPDASLTVIAQSGPKGFRANLFDRGMYSMMVSAEGYVSERRDFDLLSDSLKNSVELFYHLELIPIRLDEVLPFHKLLFDVTSYRISSSSFPELERLAEMLKENPGIKIRLEGYTDSQGKSRSNLRLAKNRIESIKKWLVKKGIDPKRIKLKALGGEKLVTNSDAPEARRANRRVEVRVIEM